MRNPNGKWLSIVRGILVAVLAVAMVLSQLGVKDSSASLETVEEQVLGSLGETDGMQKSSNRMLKKLYGLDAADYEGVVLYTSISGMDAEELLIVKLKDDSQSEAVKETIETRLQTQKNSFEGYGVSQTALLEDAIVYTRANYVLFVVHANANAAKSAFLRSL
jgi:hypothetical protein